MTATAIPATPASEQTTEVDPRSPKVRLGQFFDDGFFELITPDDDRGVLVGVGKVAGAPCVAFATDPTVQGGAMGNDGCRAIVTAYDRAFADSVPVVGIWHSGGARLREGVL
ncbi:MAG TPA: carboxyl transferase domain-containing protein, partial [Candidatus Nanopelagicales bacterium]|nr:carboxyl transferase domain-containing protein [Candidatus Nanopelagicales bacterium]